MSEQAEATRPLSGVRILALEQFVAGPYGSMVLADMGAEVIKIERPGEGDQIRLKQFEAERDGQRRLVSQFTLWNRNKKSLTLDLKSARGKEIFKDLARRADVVWENFRPGVMDALGLGYEVLRELNPRLIYASVSGFGHQDIYPSPGSDRPAFDIIGLALSGLAHMTSGPGREPAALGAIIGDVGTALMAAFGVTLALLHRQLTGLGQHLDVAMYDTCVMLNERAIGLCALSGRDFTQADDTFASPQGIFPCRDGYIAVAPQSERAWVDFCAAIGREDLLQHPELCNISLRSLHFREHIDPPFAAWARDKTRAEALEILMRHGVPCAPVQTNADVLADPQVAARRMMIELNDPLSGPVKVVGNAIKLAACPETPVGPPPLLGEHSAVVLREWLGLDDAAIEELRAAGVV